MLEAEKLPQMDHFLGIRGKSDPYAKVSIGLQHFRSQTIYKNLNPTWNEVFEVRVVLAPCESSRLYSGSCLGWALPSWASQTVGQHRDGGLGDRQAALCDFHLALAARFPEVGF